MVRLFETMFGGEKEMNSNESKNESVPISNNDKPIIGKIIKISDKGYGFISSKEIKFTRIFFHWSSLVQDTLHFTELRNGMKVEFVPIELEDKGYRAIKIRVIEDDDNDEE